MKFKVEIKEFLAEIVEVEADSEDEALSMVRDAYRKEEIILYPESFIDVEFSLYEDE
jgi:hypothetical protein